MKKKANNNNNNNQHNDFDDEDVQNTIGDSLMITRLLESKRTEQSGQAGMNFAVCPTSCS